MSKKLFLLPALVLAAFGVAFLASCKKDCKFGSDDYSGQFAVAEDCSNSPASAYNITVTYTSETDIKIANVWDRFQAATNATIDCESITIPRQQPDNDKFYVEGSGTIDKNDGVTTITLTYTVTNETDPNSIASDVCTGSVFVKL